LVEPRIATALPHQFHDHAALALHLDDLVPTVVVDLGAPLDSPSKREALSSVQVFGGPPESNTESFGQKRSLSEIQTMVRHDLRVNSRFDARVIKHKDQDGSGFLERNTDTGK
jgi:hypothetical protein